MIGVSSCLAGCKCTYSGDDKLIKLVQRDWLCEMKQ